MYGLIRTRRFLGAALGVGMSGATSFALSSRSLSSPAAAEVEMFDYVVIGGGSGGIASARRAAAYGKRVVVIERGADRDPATGSRRGGGLGGTCVNMGCVPKKLFWTAAAHAEMTHTAAGYGLALPTPAFDWEGFKERRDAYLVNLNGIYQRNLGNSKVEVIEGFARFVDAKTVEVNGRKVSADNILIAVGGKPVYPEIPGAELISTSDDFFDWPHQPKKAVVVGAGYIAVELAGVLNALGTETSLVFRGEKVLRRSFDPLVQDLVNAELERTGVAMRRGTQLQAVAKRPDGKLDVALKDGSRVDGVDVVLFAAGRTPSFDGLGLERAGVAVSDKGYIVVDEFERTSVSGVHAIGDATTHNVELTPVAIAAGRRLSDRLFGGEPNARLEYESVPTVVFSHPPIGMVGLTEPDAVQRYGAASIKTYTSSFKPMHYAMCAPELKVPMAMKLVCTGPEEKVVGIHVCGIGADEMMQGFAVALRIGATKSDFDHCVALHPTAAEEFVTMFPWGQKDGKPYLPGTLRVS